MGFHMVLFVDIDVKWYPTVTCQVEKEEEEEEGEKSIVRYLCIPFSCASGEGAKLKQRSYLPFQTTAMLGSHPANNSTMQDPLTTVFC